MSVPCRHFMRGYCQLGDSCNFLHAPAGNAGGMQMGWGKGGMQMAPQMGGMFNSPAMASVVTPGMWGAQKRPQQFDAALAQQSAKKMKTQICRHFAVGHCQMGSSCNFAHGQHEIGTVGGASPMPMMALGFGGKGGCGGAQFGMQKGGAQPQYKKTKLCNHFLTGNCHHGAGCSFAHGEHELGSPQPPQQAVQQMQQSWPQQGMQQMQQSWAPVPAFVQQSWALPQMSWGGQKGGGPGGFPGQTWKKTKLCNDFASSGTCPRGEACTFAHGEHEIGSQQPTKGGVEGPRSQAAKQVFNFKSMLCKDFISSGACPRGEGCTFAHGPEELKMPGEVAAMMADAEGIVG